LHEEQEKGGTDGNGIIKGVSIGVEGDVGIRVVVGPSVGRTGKNLVGASVGICVGSIVGLAVGTSVVRGVFVELLGTSVSTFVGGRRVFVELLVETFISTFVGGEKDGMLVEMGVGETINANIGGVGVVGKGVTMDTFTLQCGPLNPDWHTHAVETFEHIP
jgi:hypothetical protein